MILTGQDTSIALEEVPANATLNLYAHQGTVLKQIYDSQSTYQHLLGGKFVDETTG